MKIKPIVPNGRVASRQGPATSATRASTEPAIHTDAIAAPEGRAPLPIDTARACLLLDRPENA
jgi:hypothetical protein